MRVKLHDPSGPAHSHNRTQLLPHCLHTAQINEFTIRWFGPLDAAPVTVPFDRKTLIRFALCRLHSLIAISFTFAPSQMRQNCIICTSPARLWAKRKTQNSTSFAFFVMIFYWPLWSIFNSHNHLCVAVLSISIRVWSTTQRAPVRAAAAAKRCSGTWSVCRCTQKWRLDVSTMHDTIRLYSYNFDAQKTNIQLQHNPGLIGCRWCHCVALMKSFEEKETHKKKPARRIISFIYLLFSFDVLHLIKSFDDAPRNSVPSELIPFHSLSLPSYLHLSLAPYIPQPYCFFFFLADISINCLW